ncbi:unnamed protein product [Moneuplotes crassus]|uniref:Uncharacterized protein n=1 Tax=Euplotes crassus TaxID=5936 RepID=A0AAD2D3S9_EUPCR|nr:unnamed protein product [Moneuplotes crassus]
MSFFDLEHLSEPRLALCEPLCSDLLSLYPLDLCEFSFKIFLTCNPHQALFYLL